MEIKLLAPDKGTVKRMIDGCRHYGLNAKYNRKTDPYVHVNIESEEDVVNVFWLGANLSQPKIQTGMLQSIY